MCCNLVAGGKKVGINPKINNLMPGYEGAKYNLVWICDSGIRGQQNRPIHQLIAHFFRPWMLIPAPFIWQLNLTPWRT